MGHCAFFSVGKNVRISFCFCISWIRLCLPNVLFYWCIVTFDAPSKALGIFHYPELPSGFISLLQIKGDCYMMLFLDIGLSYRDFQFDHMIHCWSPLSKVTLRVGNRFIRWKIPDQSCVYHALHYFTQATSYCYWAVVFWVWVVFLRLRYRNDCSYFPWFWKCSIYPEIIEYFQKVIERILC